MDLDFDYEGADFTAYLDYDAADYPDLKFPCREEKRGQVEEDGDCRMARILFEPIDNVIESEAVESTRTFLGGYWCQSAAVPEAGQRWFCCISSAPSEWVVVDRFDFVSTRPAPNSADDTSGGLNKAIVVLKIAYCPLQPKPHEIARINLLIQGNRPAKTLEDLEAEYDR